MMAPWLCRALVLSVLTGLAACGSYCSFESYYSYSTTYKYCTYDCCTTDCCPYSFYNTVSTVYSYSALAGIIAGSVVGGIFLISGIVAVICCCIKSKSRPGRVIQPTPATTGNVMVVSSASNTNQMLSAQPGVGAPYGGQYGQQYGPLYGQQYGPQYGQQYGQQYGHLYGPQFSGPPPYQPQPAPSVNNEGQPPPSHSYGDLAYPPTSTGYPAS